MMWFVRYGNLKAIYLPLYNELHSINIKKTSLHKKCTWLRLVTCCVCQQECFITSPHLPPPLALHVVRVTRWDSLHCKGSPLLSINHLKQDLTCPKAAGLQYEKGILITDNHHHHHFNLPSITVSCLEPNVLFSWQKIFWDNSAQIFSRWFQSNILKETN